MDELLMLVPHAKCDILNIVLISVYLRDDRWFPQSLTFASQTPSPNALGRTK